MSEAELILPGDSPKPEPADAQPRWLTHWTVEDLLALAAQRPLTGREAVLLSGLLDLRSEDANTRARGRQVVLGAEAQNLSDDHASLRTGRPAYGTAGPKTVVMLPDNRRGGPPGEYDAGDARLII